VILGLRGSTCDDAPRLNLAFAAGYMFVGAYRVNLVSVFLDFQ
jgi:hypothetical protein